MSLLPPIPFASSFSSPSWDGPLNGRGLWALFSKEVWRFMKIWSQTVLSPVVMSLLFFAVFMVGPQPAGAGSQDGPVLYPAFLASGLVMMALLQNAFFNSSASLILSKIQGNIVDLVMAPLSPFEWVLAYGLAGVVRGLVVGIACAVALAFLADLPLLYPLWALYYAVAGSLLMALIGFIVGIWGDSFDHIGAIQNFVIMPATFLSGTFFTVSSLPAPWNTIGRLNPFFYLIDGFRFGFTGVCESSLWIGAPLLALINVVLFALAVKMIASGYKLKK